MMGKRIIAQVAKKHSLRQSNGSFFAFSGGHRLAYEVSLFVV
jgi:hypothetical protein